MSSKSANRKAQILVTLLGPSFAKNSDHPFFAKLIELAGAEGATFDDPAGNATMSDALADLVARLESDAPTSTRPAEAVYETPMKTPELEAQESEFSSAYSDPAPSPSTLPDDLRLQHPAVIAATAKSVNEAERTALLDSLPSATANLVKQLILRMS